MNIASLSNNTSSAQGGDRTRTEVSPRRVLRPEDTTENAVKTGVSEHLVAPALPFDQKQFNELLMVWDLLDVSARQDVLSFAQDLLNLSKKP